MTAEQKKEFTRRVSQANSAQLIVILYEIALVYVNDAISFMEKDVGHLKLIVICFDFQAELLKRYFGDLATIRTIDARKTAELFKIPYGGGAS